MIGQIICLLFTIGFNMIGRFRNAEQKEDIIQQVQQANSIVILIVTYALLSLLYFGIM